MIDFGTPNRPKIGSKRVLKGDQNHIGFLMPSWTDFLANIAPTWPDLGPQDGPSWAQNATKIGRKRVSEAMSVPGPILDRSWTALGSILNRFWNDFWSILGRLFVVFWNWFWNRQFFLFSDIASETLFRPILVPFWAQLGAILGAQIGPCWGHVGPKIDFLMFKKVLKNEHDFQQLRRAFWGRF